MVNINSQVLQCDLDTTEELTYTLVFPKDANIETGVISILAPLDTAIFGYSEGDVIEWPVPSGIRRFRMEKMLYQPGTAGDFNI